MKVVVVQNMKKINLPPKNTKKSILTVNSYLKTYYKLIEKKRPLPFIGNNTIFEQNKSINIYMIRNEFINNV